MITCNLKKIPSSSWNAEYIKRAVKSVDQSMGKNEDWLLCSILGCNDDWKLRDYMKPRVHPGVDNGFFLCIDESGVAREVLVKILAQKRHQEKGIGYFVLVPKYITEKRDYPLNLEKQQQGSERCSAYVMDKALSRLRRWRPSLFDREKVKYSQFNKYLGTAGPWFYIHRGKQRIGWAYLDRKFKSHKKN
jgi:hypothetical protein